MTTGHYLNAFAFTLISFRKIRPYPSRKQLMHVIGVKVFVLQNTIKFVSAYLYLWNMTLCFLTSNSINCCTIIFFGNKLYNLLQATVCDDSEHKTKKKTRNILTYRIWLLLTWYGKRRGDVGAGRGNRGHCNLRCLAWWPQYSRMRWLLRALFHQRYIMTLCFLTSNSNDCSTIVPLETNCIDYYMRQCVTTWNKHAKS